ncbi:MAG: IS607 family transposase [Desulfovibrio sp.]|nr:IS607 family transposase [Desulfovibrio sp.]
MSQRFYSLREFRKILGITAQTVRNWDASGKLKPHHVGANGYRYYSEEQLQKIISNNISGKIAIGYCRLSSKKQKDDLERQVEAFRVYLSNNYKRFDIIQDVGSGIDYNRPGLKRLIQLINDDKISKIIIYNKDQLAYIGFDLIKNFADLHNIQIEIINNEERPDAQELVEDMMQIITLLSCQLQGKSADHAKKLLEEIVKNENLGK